MSYILLCCVFFITHTISAEYRITLPSVSVKDSKKKEKVDSKDFLLWHAVQRDDDNPESIAKQREGTTVSDDVYTI